MFIFVFLKGSGGGGLRNRRVETILNCFSSSWLPAKYLEVLSSLNGKEQFILNCNMQTNHLRILLKCRFWWWAGLGAGGAAFLTGPRWYLCYGSQKHDMSRKGVKYFLGWFVMCAVLIYIFSLYNFGEWMDGRIPFCGCFWRPSAWVCVDGNLQI